MINTVLKYSAKEALQMMKQEFPNDYQEKINVGKQLIVRLKKFIIRKPTKKHINDILIMVVDKKAE